MENDEFNKELELIRELRQSIKEETAESIRENRESAREDRESMRKLRESQEKTDEQIKEDRESMRKLRESQKETSKEIDRIGIYIKNFNKKFEGMISTLSKGTEEFFFSSLKEKLTLGNIKFDDAIKNVREGQNSIEYDILLLNGEYVAIIEVKMSANPLEVKELKEQKIEAFRQMYPKYKNHKLLFGVASLTTNQRLESELRKHNGFLLTQKGDHLELINGEVIANV